VDLLLHVGYPKTGTTTLQRRHFSKFPGYLGSPSLLGYSGRDGLIKPLSRSAHRGDPVDLDAWRTQILGVFGEHPPERIVISNEGLLRWDAAGDARPKWSVRASPRDRGTRSGMHPFAAFLGDHVRPAWQDLGDVRVLVTIRNQSDWFCSHYVEQSDRIIGASQSDFERQVRRLIASRDGYLDFGDVVDSFRRAVGDDHVLVLLLEEMGTDGYWGALSEFGGAQEPFDGRTAGHLNQRSTAAGWRVSPYDRTRAPLRRALRDWRTGRGSKAFPTMGGFRNPAGREWVQVRRRDVEVRMTDELRTLVKARYRDSNQRLGQFLGRDLTPLGY
jgi:hypothetical protein